MTGLEREIYDELKAIRAALEALPAAIVAAIAKDLIVQDDAEAAPVGCQHPTDSRVDLGDGEWECTARFNGKVCQFRGGQ